MLFHSALPAGFRKLKIMNTLIVKEEMKELKSSCRYYTTLQLLFSANSIDEDVTYNYTA